MKQIKNATLAILGGLLILSVATVSCGKKSSGGGTTPTITSVSPNPATSGGTVTITGTGFTSPATITIGGGTAITGTVSADGTSITFTAPAATSGVLSVTTNGHTIASGTNFVVNPAHVGPTSDSVYKTALVANWKFDGNGQELISGDAPNTTIGTVTYTSAGQIGNCANFTNGALLFNPIAQIDNDTSLQSYTISLWANVPTSTGSEQLRSLFQMTGNKYSDLWGQVDLELTNSGIVGDSLTIGARQHQQDGHAPYDHEGFTALNAGLNSGICNNWVLLTETYNGSGTNETMQIYINGNRVDSAEFTNVTKPETFNLVPTGNYPTDGIVPNTKVYIGSLAFFDRGNNAGDGYTNYAPSSTDRPWAAADVTLKLDDIRVYNRPLSAAQVDSLYTIGSTGF
ncbi:MAG TPA: IPT/TIG domain-containing protein [Ferruginibacter sp.]|nr:IPT/TIG domain-containing protein [Ferruginibacter sp.]